MKFFLFLLLIAAGITGYFYYQKATLEREEHFWTNQCKEPLTALVRPSSEGIEPDEAAFFKFLLVLHKAQAAKMDLSKIFTSACTELGVGDDATSVYWESVNTDFTTANDLKIFDDPDNLINLERGDSPVITNSDWKGEKLGLLQIVPPLLAPEASKSLANLVLVPEIVRNATPQTVTSTVVDRSYQLMSHGIVTRTSHDHILAAKATDTN